MKKAEPFKMKRTGPYEIVRRYIAEGKERVLRNKITLKHAREHCNNKESSYLTCQKPAALNRTDKRGPWFDVYRVRSYYK